MASTMLINAHLPNTFWHDATLTAVYAINRLPTPILKGFSPYHKLFLNRLDYGFLCVFGS